MVSLKLRGLSPRRERHRLGLRKWQVFYSAIMLFRPGTDFTPRTFLMQWHTPAGHAHGEEADFMLRGLSVTCSVINSDQAPTLSAPTPASCHDSHCLLPQQATEGNLQSRLFPSFFNRFWDFLTFDKCFWLKQKGGKRCSRLPRGKWTRYQPERSFINLSPCFRS